MPNTTEYSFPIQGMITDLHQLNTDAKNYSFALNAITADKFGGNEIMLQNEMSNHCSVEFPPNYQVVGFKEIPEQNRVIYFLHNSLTGISQIGEVRNCIFTDITDKIEKTYCDTCPEYISSEKIPLEKRKEVCYCQYIMIIQSNCLNFSIHHPIDIEYKITNCSLNLYFTDNLNERRFIYFDYKNNDQLDELILQDQFKTLGIKQFDCDCPEGYILNTNTGLCEGIITTPIVPSAETRTACNAVSDAWVNFGVTLYSTFNTDGTGISTLHHLTDTYWSNSAANTSNGVLNRVALWACDAAGLPQTSSDYLPLDENIGFIFPIDVLATKTYYVGIGGDNKVRIRVNCQTIVDMDPLAMGVQYPTAGISAPFKYWHIYPITLTPGRNVIELTGLNYGGPGGFGAEIYDNTAAEIIAATNGIGLNIIFSTANMIGMPLQVSSTFSGNCPNGTCLDINQLGQLVCTSIDIQEPICTDCYTQIYNNELDCEKIKVHQNYNKPCIKFNGFVNGGNLKAGTYQVLIAYADVYGNPISHYFPSSHIAPLFENQITFETNYTTNKALSFEVENLKSDSLFQYYNIVIAQTIENFTEFNLIATLSTTQNKYTYTGYDIPIKRLTPQETLFRRPYYEKAKGVTKANNYLFYTGVSEYPILNLQPAVNNIQLQWETVAIREDVYKDPRNTFYFHTYQRDEVYSFGIVFEFINGRETCAFHIPGRIATIEDLEIINNNDVINDLTCDATIRNLRWQVYNTANVQGGDYEYNDNCEITKCWEYGNFAYWESTDTYPQVKEIWGELCGKPIRHHKFPDSCVSHIHDGNNANKTFNDGNYVFPIGVRINHQSVLNALQQAVLQGLITQQQKDSIISYRIVRGNRVGNKSITAKGLLFNLWRYNKFGKEYYYPNYAYNDLHNDNYISNDPNTYDGSTTSPPIPNTYYGGHDRFTFHSPDIHFVNTAIGNILKVETEEYGQSEGYFTHSECEARQRFLSTAARSIALGLGIAAALSATGEKQCKVITYEANTVHDSTSNVSGTIPYGNVSGTLTTGSGTISTSQASGNWNGQGTAHGVSSQNGIDGVNAQDVDLGSNTSPVNSNSIIIGGFNDTLTTIDINGNSTNLVKPKSVEYTTCKGAPYQIFNSNVIIQGLLLLGGAGVGLIIQRAILGIMEADKIIQTLETLIPYKRYGIQYNSVGKYNNYSCVPINNKRRNILKSAYLLSDLQSVDEQLNLSTDIYNTININNWSRESSLYIKIPTNNSLLAPTHIDNSRVTMDQQFGSGQYNKLNTIFNRNISSYYVSLKNDVLNQYGKICDIEYLETNSCSFFLNKQYSICEAKVFGGDTFITRFALKRKMPFFLHSMCKLPDGSDVVYSELGNVGYPNYYHDASKPFFDRINGLGGGIGAFGQDVIGVNESRMDAKTSKFFYQNGYIHLYHYGIPYFLVESDINTDYRHGQNNKDKDFYPHNKDLKTWFEEENVPISIDNFYFYNRTYSKQNKESVICTSCILDKKDLSCQLIKENTLIYSEPTDTENKNDNWLIFKANNFWNFPLSFGKLITADGIENDKVLVRLERGTQIFPAYNEILATEENIQVGTGGMFKTPPKTLAVTDLGYAGTQHKDILHTEYGHIWADSISGNIFNLGSGGGSLDEISKEGMKAWFKENLPFNLKKSFPEIPNEFFDNNLNSIGLHYCFDKRFARILITKLDYKLLDSNVKFNKQTNTFYILEGQQQVPISLKNTKYFCNKSWTISYSLHNKSWTSYHSYIPEFYVEYIDRFDSSFKRGNIQKTYSHNVSNKSYQVFYGKLHPFIIEVQAKQSFANNTVNSVEYYLDIIRYHNEFDTFYNRTKTFNKAIIYNERQISPLLTFKVSDPEDLTEILEYPKRTTTGYEILTTNSENIWRFNDFWDAGRNQLNNIPLFIYDCNNVDKQINPKAVDNDKDDFDRALIRQRMCRIRLINDAESNYHFIFGYGQINQKQSFR